ncbi:MBL fold metallo-hydrolase, partial [Patescibacteria group bacterium]|nr:MBL fold metallo-hydrolase [Patescibacteria group bacterium]MBU1457437.1 MBL fold metallo-hydrolase [Patescibacteria group bacterium]
ADVVILESTYGDRLHEDEDEEKILREEIEKVSRNKGVLLIPVFSIQRSQRILHLLDHIQRQGGLPGGMKVYFDSPMAIEATKIFGKYRQYYSRELADQAKKDDPFDFPGLVVTRQAWEKKIIRKDKKAKIIVAGSGMMSGGRIMGHAKEYLPKPSTRLLIVGYQAKGTLGREIVDKVLNQVQDDVLVNIDGVRVEVNAKVRQIYSMSAHADQEQLLKWLSKIKGVKKVILTHGEDEPRRVLGEKVKTRFGLEVDKPILGEEIEYL